MATKLGTLTLDLIAKTAGFTEPMKKAGDTAERESKRIENSAGSAIEMIKGLGAAALAGFTVGAVISMADEYTQMAAQIRNATSSQQEYNKVQQHLLETANTTYRSLKEAQQVYLDVGGALKAYGETTDRSLRITDSLSFSFTHNATAADKAASATDAYMKSIYSGKVSGDAWISILSAIPSIVGDLSKSLNKSEADILSMGNAGELSTKDLNNALDASREKSEALANNMSNSLPDGLNNARNGFLVLAGTINETYGVTNTMAAGLGVVGDIAKLAADNLDVLGKVTLVAGAYLVGTYIPAIALSAKTLTTDTAAKVSNLLATRSKILADYEVAKANLAATAAMIKSMGATNAQTAAMMTNARAAYQQAAAAKASMFAGSGLIGILGGPVGLGITVAATAASYLLLNGSTKKSTESLRENNESVKDAIEKYTMLDKIKRADQLVAEKEKLKELTDGYASANASLVAYTLKVIRNADLTSDQAKSFSQLVMNYKEGKITLEQLADAIQKNTAFSQQQKDEWIKKAAGVRDASTEMGKHKTLVQEIAKVNTDLKLSHDRVTGAVNQQKSAYEQLTEQQKKVIDNLKQESLRSSYINKNMLQGWSREKAEFFADKRSEAGVPYTSAMPKTLFLEIEAGYKLQLQNKVREEAEKKVADQKQKQLELSQKQYQYSKSEIEMLKRVAEIGAKNNLNDIGAKYGIPENMLAAVMAQESKGITNAKSPTGAIGPFQTTSIYRTQHGLSVADSYDVKKSAEAAAKDLAASFEVFGNWNDAITAYNAGIQGTKNFKSNGFTQSAAKTKEVKGYASAVNKWFVGLNGGNAKDEGFAQQDTTATLKDYVDFQKDMEAIRQKSLDLQKSVQQTYFTGEQQLTFEHEEKIKAIELAYAGDDAAIKKYTELQNSAYKKDLEEYQETQKFKTLADKRQLLEAKRFWISATEYAKEYYALIREEILNTAEYSPDMQHALIKQANAEQGMESNAEREQVWEDYKSMMGLEKSPYQEDMDLLAEARAQMLLTEEEYHRDRANLQIQWGSNFVQGAAGVLAQVFGENSKAYQAMFAVQKAMAVAQVLMNAPATYSAVLASASMIPLVGPYIAPGLAAGAVALQMAQASMIGSVSFNPVGMAHDGIDNIPKEGTWLLDKGERVVDARTNGDLKDFIANNNSGPKVIINVPAGHTAKQNVGTDGTVTIDVVRQEIAGAFNSVRRPNSTESRVFQDTFGLSPSR